MVTKAIQYFKKFLFVLAIAGTTFVLLLVAQKMSQKPKDAAPVPTAENIRPVKAVRIQKTSNTHLRKFPGKAKAAQNVKLAFRVSGPICDFPVMVGEKVEKGNLIAQIDSRDFQVQIRRLEASLVEAQASLKAMKRGAREEDVVALKANLKAAQAKLQEANLQLTRYQQLVKENSVPKATYENVESAHQVALSKVDALEQELKKAMAGARSEEIEAVDARISGLIAQLDAAKNSLQDTSLRAPFTGYVSHKFVENFENVQAGMPIVSFIDCSTIEVTIGIPEEIVAQKEFFRGFECEFDVYPGKQVPAVVKEIGKDSISSSQTYPLTVKINPENTLILPGMTATISIKISPGEKSLFEIPVEALSTMQDGSYFTWSYDHANKIVTRKQVRVGRVNSSGIEILEGLKEDEWIITAGVHYLQEGQKVRLVSDGSEGY